MGGENGGLAIVKDVVVSQSLSDYVVECDMKMESRANGFGVFGIAFRTNNNGGFYAFQLKEQRGQANI